MNLSMERCVNFDFIFAALMRKRNLLESTLAIQTRLELKLKRDAESAASAEAESAASANKPTQPAAEDDAEKVDRPPGTTPPNSSLLGEANSPLEEVVDDDDAPLIRDAPGLITSPIQPTIPPFQIASRLPAPGSTSKPKKPLRAVGKTNAAAAAAAKLAAAAAAVDADAIAAEAKIAADAMWADAHASLGEAAAEDAAAKLAGAKAASDLGAASAQLPPATCSIQHSTGMFPLPDHVGLLFDLLPPEEDAAAKDAAMADAAIQPI